MLSLSKTRPGRSPVAPVLVPRAGPGSPPGRSPAAHSGEGHEGVVTPAAEFSEDGGAEPVVRSCDDSSPELSVAGEPADGDVGPAEEDSDDDSDDDAGPEEDSGSDDFGSAGFDLDGEDEDDGELDEDGEDDEEEE